MLQHPQKWVISLHNSFKINANHTRYNSPTSLSLPALAELYAQNFYRNSKNLTSKHSILSGLRAISSQKTTPRKGVFTHFSTVFSRYLPTPANKPTPSIGNPTHEEKDSFRIVTTGVFAFHSGTSSHTATIHQSQLWEMQEAAYLWSAGPAPIQWYFSDE